MLQIDWLGLWRVPFVEFPPARQLEGLTLLALYFLTLVWAATAAFRYLGGEPWASIVRRPLGFLP